jgi:predicted TIM-barrel fold metal-dependent hydrolase
MSPPCGTGTRRRSSAPGGAVDPFKGEQAIAEAITAVGEHHVLGFHFHPIMGHYAVDEPALNPLFETIAGLGVPVMIDVGTTGMGAGMPAASAPGLSTPGRSAWITWPPGSPR